VRIVGVHGIPSDDSRGNGRVLEARKAANVGFGEGGTVAFVGANPEAGEVIPESGGVRKFRWALQGTGKRGGARVIYYYHNKRLPLFLLSTYAKNRKANLSKAERNAMKRLVPALVAGYPRKA
jgi:hypothetical protein